MEKLKKLKAPTDELAALLFGLVALLHTGGVLDRLGVSESFALDVVTWGMTGAALFRTWWRSRKSTPTETVEKRVNLIVDADTTDAVRSISRLIELVRTMPPVPATPGLGDPDAETPRIDLDATLADHEEILR